MLLASAVVAAAAPTDGLAECDKFLVVLFGNSANSGAFGFLPFSIVFVDINNDFFLIFEFFRRDFTLVRLKQIAQ